MEIKKKQTLLLTTLMLISLLAAIYIIYILAAPDAYGKYLDPTTKVNANKQTDLFDKSVDDWSGLQSQIQSQKQSIVGGIKSEQGLDALAKENKSQIQSGASSLSSISATELNSRGQEEVLKENVLNDLYVDFSRPLNKQHMVDAKKIAKGQDKLLANLLEKLKELGVDCKTVKGPVEKEPAYYLQIEKTQHKDTIYNKTICEDLRNQYDCTDSLSLTCKRKGFVKTEKAKIYIPAGEVEHLFHADQWGRSTFWEMHLVTGIIAAKIGASADNIIMEEKQIIRWAKRNGKFFNRFIGYTIDDNGQLGNGNHGDTYNGYNHFAQGFDPSYGFHKPTWCGNQSWHPGTAIRFWYSLAEEVCEEWNEDWTERCNITHITRTVPSDKRRGQR